MDLIKVLPSLDVTMAGQTVFDLSVCFCIGFKRKLPIQLRHCRSPKSHKCWLSCQKGVEQHRMLSTISKIHETKGLLL